MELEGILRHSKGILIGIPKEQGILFKTIAFYKASASDAFGFIVKRNGFQREGVQSGKCYRYTPLFFSFYAVARRR